MEWGSPDRFGTGSAGEVIGAAGRGERLPAAALNRPPSGVDTDSVPTYDEKPWWELEGEPPPHDGRFKLRSNGYKTNTLAPGGSGSNGESNDESVPACRRRTGRTAIDSTRV